VVYSSTIEIAREVAISIS